MKTLKITETIAKMIELKDDDTETGGISFRGETLADFIEETDLGYGHSLDEVNEALNECGIMPIGEDEITSPYKIILEEVLYKGGYIPIPKENRQEFVFTDDDVERKTKIKSVVLVCESMYMTTDVCDQPYWEKVCVLKAIDEDDEMWDVDDCLENGDLERLCEIVVSLN